MEIGNTTKGQQPDKIAASSRRSLMCRQRSDNIPHPEMGLDWLLNKIDCVLDQ